VKGDINSMTTLKVNTQTVVAGVDTHQLTHHAAVLGTDGRLLDDREFPATAVGHQALLDWVAGFGLIEAVGVESTGSYGAGLATLLLTAGLEVIEVAGPDKTTRSMRGKSDPIDAEAAARQVLAGTATGRPKIKTGIVESIRAVKIPRDGAVKDRTRAYSQLRDLVTTAPAAIHDELIGLTGKQRATKAAGYRPDPTRLTDPVQATKKSLRQLARRIHALDAEIDQADADLERLVKQATPSLLALPQVGTQTCAQMVITAGQNIDRMGSEARFAKLTGTAPIPASSGKTSRVRLNRGGDRQANSALHLVIIGRLNTHQPTRDYLARRTAEGKEFMETTRCLKRYLARAVYRALRHDLMAG
jgi:transposase